MIKIYPSYTISLKENTTWGIIEGFPSIQQIQTIIFSTDDNELDISKVTLSLH
jgi:hypothetical protein